VRRMAIVVHDAAAKPRTRKSLIGGQSVPAHGLGIVLRHAPAIVVQFATLGLCSGTPVVCRVAEPLRGLLIVQWHAATKVVRVPSIT
jgi:hypothetical protein